MRVSDKTGGVEMTYSLEKTSIMSDTLSVDALDGIQCRSQLEKLKRQASRIQQFIHTQFIVG